MVSPVDHGLVYNQSRSSNFTHGVSVKAGVFFREIVINIITVQSGLVDLLWQVYVLVVRQ